MLKLVSMEYLVHNPGNDISATCTTYASALKKAQPGATILQKYYYDTGETDIKVIQWKGMNYESIND